MDEDRVKDLLLDIVAKIESCFEPNQYNDSVFQEIRHKIYIADLRKDEGI